MKNVFGASMKRVIAIAAMDEGRVIGANNAIPWKLPEDMERFRTLTNGHTVLMGRKTWESLPSKFRPLPNRKNIVITSRPDSIDAPPGVIRYSSPDAAVLSFLEGNEEFPSELLWIMGGGQIYRATVSMWNDVYLSRIDGKRQGDAFFPEFEERFTLVEEEKREGFTFLHYRRK